MEIKPQKAQKRNFITHRTHHAFILEKLRSHSFAFLQIGLTLKGVAFFNAGCSALASRYVEVKRKSPDFHIQGQTEGTRNRVFCLLEKRVYLLQIWKVGTFLLAATKTGAIRLTWCSM